MRAQFATTSWSQVLAARDAPSVASRDALENLCRSYWYPLYVFVRRQGYSPEESQDLTQGYFLQLIEKGYLQDYDRSLGRFRVFLKTSIGHFLSNERERAQAWKRGGRATTISFEVENVEERYRLEPIERLTPEDIYERRWALTLVERVLAGLRTEFRDEGQEERFERLKPFLTGEHPSSSYAEIATVLGSSETAVKTAVHRLRRRFGTLLRSEIADTVVSDDLIDDELRHLLRRVGT